MKNKLSLNTINKVRDIVEKIINCNFISNEIMINNNTIEIYLYSNEGLIQLNDNTKTLIETLTSFLDYENEIRKEFNIEVFNYNIILNRNFEENKETKLIQITDKELIDTLLVLNDSCRRLSTDGLFIMNTETNEIYVDCSLRMATKTPYKYLTYKPLAKIIDNYIIKL